MAETGESVISSALQEILVQASEAPLEPDDFEVGRVSMNRMMDSYAASGINLGYTTVNKLADPITVPDGAIDGMVFNLAIRLAPQYDRPVSIDLKDNAKDGKEAMRSIAFTILPSAFPDTLPRGSGNEQDNNTNTQTFYP